MTGRYFECHNTSRSRLQGIILLCHPIPEVVLAGQGRLCLRSPVPWQLEKGAKYAQRHPDALWLGSAVSGTAGPHVAQSRSFEGVERNATSPSHGKTSSALCRTLRSSKIITDLASVPWTAHRLGTLNACKRPQHSLACCKGPHSPQECYCERPHRVSGQPDKLRSAFRVADTKRCKDLEAYCGLDILSTAAIEETGQLMRQSGSGDRSDRALRCTAHASDHALATIWRRLARSYAPDQCIARAARLTLILLRCCKVGCEK